MKKAWLLPFFGLLFVLAACGSGDGTTLPSPDSLTAEAPGVEVRLVDLASDSAAYEDRFVGASGQYAELPMPPCNAAVHLPPATWSLIADGVVVRMAGLENVLRPLAADGQTVAVQGYWRRWDGPVGCGEAAFPSTVWYLQVKRILNPNPLVQATFTPIAAARVEALQSPSAPGLLPSEGLNGSPTSTPTIGPTATPSAVPTHPPSPLVTPTGPYSPLPTLSPPASPTLVSLGDALPTYTPLPTATDVDSPIATPETSTSGTASPTATRTPTPSPSPTTPPALLHMGATSIDRVFNGWLATAQTHSWIYSATAGEVITITVGPTGGVDLELTVNDPTGVKVAGRDYTPAGGEETVAALELSKTGDYQILVSEVHGYAGDYGLVVLNGYSVDIRFPGNLIYGATRTTTLPANTYQIWHFQGTVGDRAVIRLAPTDNTDLAYSLYGPDMDTLIRRVDAGGPGYAEEATFQLATTGFYSIWLEEYGRGEAAYTLSLTDAD